MGQNDQAGTETSDIDESRDNAKNLTVLGEVRVVGTGAKGIGRTKGCGEVVAMARDNVRWNSRSLKV